MDPSCQACLYDMPAASNRKVSKNTRISVKTRKKQSSKARSADTDKSCCPNPPKPRKAPSKTRKQVRKKPDSEEDVIVIQRFPRVKSNRNLLKNTSSVRAIPVDEFQSMVKRTLSQAVFPNLTVNASSEIVFADKIDELCSYITQLNGKLKKYDGKKTVIDELSLDTICNKLASSSRKKSEMRGLYGNLGSSKQTRSKQRKASQVRSKQTRSKSQARSSKVRSKSQQKSSQVRSNKGMSKQARSNSQARSSRVRSKPAKVRSNQAKSKQVRSSQVKSIQIHSYEG